MSEKEIEQKLNAYFGFAMKKKSVFVGMKLEEMLSQDKIALLIFLPECSIKNEEKLLRITKKDSLFHSLRYTGNYDIKNALGYDKLKACGIQDIPLAKAIYETLSLDLEEKK